ncbi:hypothetical protein Tco_1549936 [Tanacetum coccineum]
MSKKMCPDPEWSKDPNADVGLEQTWFHELEKTAKDPVKFDDLMGSTIDFSNFIKNHHMKDKFTKAKLEGLVFKLLKGTCKSSPPGHLTIPVDFFFSNDFEYLKTGNKERKYTTSITKIKAVRKSRHEVYPTMKIISVIRVKVDKQFGYSYLEEIVVRRADQKEYTFKEGDFPRLHLNDIEDMLLLHI